MGPRKSNMGHHTRKVKAKQRRFLIKTEELSLLREVPIQNMAQKRVNNTAEKRVNNTAEKRADIQEERRLGSRKLREAVLNRLRYQQKKHVAQKMNGKGHQETTDQSPSILHAQPSYNLIHFKFWYYSFDNLNRNYLIFVLLFFLFLFVHSEQQYQRVAEYN